MHTVYGREMPSHCALYFAATPSHATRRLSCLKLAAAAEVQKPGVANDQPCHSVVPCGMSGSFSRVQPVGTATSKPAGSP